MLEKGAVIRRQILRDFHADSCIASTRIGGVIVDSVAHVENYPLSVALSVFNQAMMLRAEQEGGLPRTQAITKQWSEECGAWSVGVGFPIPGAPADRWPGHLVLIVQRRWLWDLSIDQANRPARNIEFKTPAVLPVTERFLRGREKLVAWWEGSLLVYDARPDDKSFRLSNNWEMDVRVGLKRGALHELMDTHEKERDANKDPLLKLLEELY